MNTPPNFPTPPAVLTRLATLAASDTPDLADTCKEIAEAFSRLSRDAYQIGDEARGDRLFAKSLAWAMAGETGDLSLVRP